MRRLIAGAILVAALGDRDARGDCGPADGIDHVLPVDGSRAVHPAALVVVRHALEDAPSGDAEPPSVVVLDARGDEVEGSSGWDGREVLFAPAASLEGETTFSVEASRPNRGSFVYSFETGASGTPPVAPALGPTLEARAEYLGGGPEDDPCGPEGLERYRVRLRLPAARGSSGRANLAYIVFQTRGHGVAEPTERARLVDEAGADPVDLDLYLPADGVEGTACFRVLAQDVTGLPSGTTDEACVDLQEGPFFRSLCATSPGGAFGWPGVSLVLAGLLARRRRGTSAGA